MRRDGAAEPGMPMVRHPADWSLAGKITALSVGACTTSAVQVSQQVEQMGGQGHPLVIFLDIDGVLAPVAGWDRYGDLDPRCLQILNEIVALTGAEIVVSSTVRYGKTIEELQALLDDAGFTGRVIDKTPTETRGLDRGDEIGLWLAAHPVERFVILDDHRDMGKLIGHLVQTSAGSGLRPTDVEPALEKLGLSIVPTDEAVIRRK